VDEPLRGAPAGLREALAGAEVEQAWREGPRTYLRAGEVFARFSLAEEDVPVFEHEARVRGLVGETGALRAPPILAHGRGWLLERQVVSQDEGVEVVIAAAAAIAHLELPAPPAKTGAQPAHALRRRLRLLRHPRLAPELARSSRLLAASRLPEVTTHGDFHPGNVLRAGGGGWVIDWELNGRGPAGSDLMRYWATIDDPADRERLYEGALELTGDELELARLRYAVAAVTVADRLTHAERTAGDLESGKALLGRLPQLRAAARLGRGRTARAAGPPE
jgi:hypothetical protein